MYRPIQFCLLLIVASLSLSAQPGTPLPKLTPSYSEDFSDYHSYPSMCFSKVFTDSKGRLWLRTCPSLSGSKHLHLFQFDGYQFKLVQGELEKLKPSDRIFELYQGNQLVGSYDKEDEAGIFFYHLDNNTISFYPLKEKGSIFNISVTPDERVFVISEINDGLSFYEWVDGDFQLQKEVSGLVYDKDFFAESNYIPVLYHDQRFFVGAFNDGKKILKIDFETGEIQSFPYVDFLTLQRYDFLEARNRVEFRSVVRGSEIFFCPTEFYSNHFFKFDVITGKIEKIPGIRDDIWTKGVFLDESGNVIFLYRDKSELNNAILETSEGTRYDYTAFFKDKNFKGVTDMASRDFTRQSYICNERGLSVHLASAGEAIKHFMPGESVRAMAEINENTVFAHTQSRVTFQIDRTTGISLVDTSTCKFGWTKITKGPDGRFWSFSFGDFTAYDPITGSCEKYTTNGKMIRLFTFAGKDKIAFVDRDEVLYIFDLNSKKTTPFFQTDAPKELSQVTHDIHYSKDNILWIASASGLWKIDLENNTSEVLGFEPPFKEHRFMCIHEDEKGRLWLGTPLHGIYIFDPVTGNVKNLSSDDGLANNTVAFIIADDDGTRWLGSYNGISLVSPEGEFITNLYEEDGLVEKESNRYSYLKTSDGKLFLGTIDGLDVIDPKKIKERLASLTDLKIYPTSITYFDNNSGERLTREYGITDPVSVNLPATSRFLNIDFALSNYIKPENNQYAYQIEGLHDEWTLIGNKPYLSLNDLPAGNYNLLIKGTDGQGNWTKNSLIVNIRAADFFYKQTWFYLSGLLLIVGLSLLWISRLRKEVSKATRVIVKDKQVIEEQAAKLKELDEAKSKFFTNISHEFRTPLTVISGMIDQVRDKPDQWLDKGSEIIKRNAASLLDLINQILDLRKLESDSLKVQNVQGDIIPYLSYLADTYRNYAQSKGLELHFLSETTSIKMDYDPDKVLRVVSNLLSNAIKYTPSGGHVYFQVEQNGDRENRQKALLIRVKDTGIGIPEDLLPNIFDRFYQVNESSTRKEEGTGIGLALIKELVELMNGTIEVTSKIDIGTTFLVSLPVTNKALIDETVSTGMLEVSEILVPNESEESMILASNGDTENQLPRLLLVEDNHDLVQFLVATLEDRYQLQIARDGEEGINLALQEVPDLIISDVMMPGKNGYELCETLKQDERSSHIPIILLTAKADMDSKIAGLEFGADAYMTKPFEERELHVRLKKLFELRNTLQERYRTSGLQTDSFNKEDAFILKVQEAIEAKLEDDTFGIPQLCRAVKLSRAQLHNKLKALTGLSTSIFMRNFRLQKAKTLLDTTDFNVSEVAYKVGFKDPNYFTRVFTERYGSSPSKTRK
ncbi:MAG: ATP-binding protein [Bacteroidota bacterium]